MSNIKHSFDDHTATIPAVQEIPATPAAPRRMTLNMGPQHPSTHGVLRVLLELDGETVVRAVPDLGYLHTGIEKSCEDKTYSQAITLTDRMDYLNPLGNNLVYCLAVEKLLGLEIPKRAQYIRVLLVELQRISSHLVWLGTHAIDLGAMSVFLYCFREREEILKIFEMFAGQRMMTSYIRIGGIALEPPAGWRAAVDRFLKMMPSRIDEYETLLTENRIWKQRLVGIGVVPPERALALGFTGPMLRGSGIAWDLRKKQPYEVYDKLDFDIPVGTNGDCYDRYLVRVQEMRESNRIIAQCVDWLRKNPGPVITANHKVAPPTRVEMKESMEELIHHFKLFTEGMHVPPGEAYAAVEHPKGEFGIFLVSDGANKPWRMKIRAPGFCHLAALDEMVRGHMIADVVAVIGTLDIVFGEIDR